MKASNSPLSILILVLASLLLIVCGFSSGDATNPLSAPTSGVSIIPTNAEKITAKVWGSESILQGMTTPSDLLRGVSIGIPHSNFNYPDLLIWQLEQATALLGGIDAGSMTDEPIERTQPCSKGGSYNLSSDVLVPNALSIGDRFTVTFHDCAELGFVLNGSMSLTMTLVSEGYDGMPPYVLGFQALMTSLSIREGSLVMTSDGDMEVVLQEDASGDAKMEVSGNSFETSVADEVELLTDYRYVVSTIGSTGVFSLELQGSLASTGVGGAVSFVTLTPFSGRESVAEGKPTACVLQISSGLDRSQARATAQADGVNVLIEVDTDGIGGYDYAALTTWKALENL